MDRTKQLIEELIQHLEGSQSDDLMGLIEKSKNPAVHVEKVDVMKPKGAFDDQANDAISQVGKDDSSEDPAEEAAESPAEEAKEPGEGGDMTDDELAQLLKEYLH